MIYGVTGAGKTVLAARLADTTAIEWHSVDDLTWEPGWVEVPADEQRRRIICERPEWILDTAYGKWLDVPLGHAQLIVALDYPRWFSLQQAGSQDRDPAVRSTLDLQREPGIIARTVLTRRDYHLALQVLQPQAAADPPVVQRSSRTTRRAPHVLAPDGRVAERTTRASTRSLATTFGYTIAISAVAAALFLRRDPT